MADNRIHESRHPADTDQKTEDPLAELARIVGFDNEETGTAAGVGVGCCVAWSVLVWTA